MSISSPSGLHDFLDSIGARPRKRLSQNFLIDQNILRKIVAVAQVKENDQVLEIGPGPGALTEALLKTGCHLIAVEKDERFAQQLHRFPGVEVFSGDICDFPFDTL